MQGYISEIRFNEYRPVRKGDTLVVIDDAYMRMRVAQARADYQNALAGREVVIALSYSPLRPQAVFPKWKTIRRIMRHMVRMGKDDDCETPNLDPSRL